jgi:hypothetical protein
VHINRLSLDQHFNSGTPFNGNTEKGTYDANNFPH